MKQAISYIIVDPNSKQALQNALRQAILDKLLELYRDLDF